MKNKQKVVGAAAGTPGQDSAADLAPSPVGSGEPGSTGTRRRMGLRRLQTVWQRCHRSQMSSGARGGTAGVFPVIGCLWEVFVWMRERKRALSHTPPGLCRMQGWNGAGGSRGSVGARPGFCAEPSFHALQIKAVMGEALGRVALGRDGCMQMLSETVLGKTGMLPEIQKTCSGTENFPFLPISFSFPLSPFPSPPTS